MLQTSILFQNHMVLQRNKKVKIWRTANAGEQITVTMQGMTATALADGDGKWEAVCGPFSTSFMEKMTIAPKERRLYTRTFKSGRYGWQADSPMKPEILI